MSQTWLQKRLNAIELYTVDVILGRRADAGAVVYGAFLQVLSYLFSGIAQSRLWLYRERILHDQPLGCLVVVVGNLTVGGTGKTPVVEKFARALRDRGRHVAILSRGYKSKQPPVWKRWWRAREIPQCWHNWPAGRCGPSATCFSRLCRGSLSHITVF